jgi:prepilin-type N-terminal cleavage/methylation domain-containing protein
MLPKAMKTPPAKSAFTLIELLAVIFVLAIITALLIPALTDRGSQRSGLAACMSNQRQIVIGFTMWKDDHHERFPWQISITNRSTDEYLLRDAASNYQILSNYLVRPKAFVCPTDKARVAAANFAQFDNRNVSYFVGHDTGKNYRASILTGDRNLENNGKPISPGLFTYSKDCLLNWTRELHDQVKNGPIGVLSFVDGHTEAVRNVNLNTVFQRHGSTTNRFVIP